MCEKRFLLVYGSQTGQAKAISEEIRDRAVQKGFRPEVYCLSQSEKKFHLEKEPVIVIVVSTTGDGDAPDTANKFWRRLKKRTLPSDHLANCKYALLGLGDTNYSNFCNMGQMLNKRLLDLGASQFYPPGFADDAVGLELVVEPWIDGLWDSLEAILSPSSERSGTGICHDTASELLVQTVVKVPFGTCTSIKDSQSVRNVDEIRTIDGSGDRGDRIESMQREVGADNVKQTQLGNDELRAVKSGPSAAAVSELALSFEDKVSVSKEPSSMQTVSSSTDKSMSSTERDKVKEGQSSPAEVGVATASSKDSNGGSKRKSNSREDGSAMEELKTPSRELAGVSLNLPSAQPSFIKVLLKNALADSAVVEFPFTKIHYAIKSSVSMATIVKSRLLTREGSVKRTLELEIDIKDCPRLTSYQPGDAFGFVCPNPTSEVNWLLNRLNLLSDSQKLMTLSILPDTTKRNPILPKHIPNPCSIVHYFTHCAGIRCVPKKAFLCYLSTCCSSSVEKRRLEELSSRQGAKDYSRFFLEERNDFLDLLSAFPSCQPQLSKLIELLPRLQPRHYSAASSPLVDPGRLKIVFNVEELPRRVWLKEERWGLATGWFSNVAVPQMTSGKLVQVPIFPRVLNPFHLPDDPATPIIMIGPGTGVSPFIGFLEHRLQQQLRVSESAEKRGGVGKAWLFFGCRHPDKDYLYRTELEKLLTSEVLYHLHVSFSRYPSDKLNAEQPKYVQDNMRLHWEELGKWIMEEDASVFVCGDASNMAKDINDALLEVLTKYLQTKPGCSEETAESVLQQLKENCKYLVDAWG